MVAGANRTPYCPDRTRRQSEVCPHYRQNFFNVKKTFKTHLDTSANLMTDEHKKFRKIGRSYASHETVHHGRNEYARGIVRANTIEGVFSISKRGMTDVPGCTENPMMRSGPITSWMA
jgi:ISXO2-like transposase domain